VLTGSQNLKISTKMDVTDEENRPLLGQMRGGYTKVEEGKLNIEHLVNLFSQ